MTRGAMGGRAIARMQATRRIGTSGQRRWNSTQPPQPAASKPVSPHVGFYKVFARPIAKVLLLATFTYQLAYWGWVKLEKDEVKAERTAEIEGLERKLGELTGKGKPPAP